MHWIVTGNGSIAQRHIQNIRTLWPHSTITSFITHRKLIDGDQKNSAADYLTDDINQIEKIIPYAVIIATPAIRHVDEALYWTSKNVPVFIEKPLSSSIKDAQRLNINSTHYIMIGYVLRFFPIVKALKEMIHSNKYGAVLSLSAYVGSYLPDWRPNKDYKICVSASASLGGGALLELSHEIDYVLWMLGSAETISANISNSGKLDIDVEDEVNIFLSYSDNKKAKIHMNFLDKPANRECRIKFENADIYANLINGVLEITDIENNKNILSFLPETPNTPYLDELLEFHYYIENKIVSPITTQDGINVLNIIEHAKLSSAKNQKEIPIEDN